MQNYDINLVTKYYFENNLSLKEVGDKIGYTAAGVRLILKRHEFSRKKQNNGGRNKSHSLNINYFKEINSPSKAYILGLLFADGSVSKKWSKVTLALNDRELVELFQHELESTHKLGEYKIHDKRTGKLYTRYSLQVPCKEMVDDLADLGLHPAKSFTCPFPNIPEEYFWHFVRGLFDGDGSICEDNRKKEGALRFSIIGSEQLILSLKNKFDEVGLTNTKVNYPGYSSEDGCLCKINYSSFKDLKYIQTKLYENSEGLRLTRKYEVFQTLAEYKKGVYDRSKYLRKIKMCDLDGNSIKVFKNIHEACDEIGATYRMVHRVAIGGRGQTKGYRFEYL